MHFRLCAHESARAAAQKEPRTLCSFVLIERGQHKDDGHIPWPRRHILPSAIIRRMAFSVCVHGNEQLIHMDLWDVAHCCFDHVNCVGLAIV